MSGASEQARSVAGSGGDAYDRAMRACLLCILSACSTPVAIAPGEADTGSAGVDAGALEVAEDAGPEVAADTATAGDTGGADTAEAEDSGATETAPLDTGPEACAPLDAGAACPALGPVERACGPAPDGCGGKVDCGGCIATRRCAAKSTDVVPHCTCETIAGACTLYSGAVGLKVRCGPIDAPLAEGSRLIPQPDGKITMYCIPG